MGNVNANKNTDNLEPAVKEKLQQQADELKKKVDANDFTGAMASINDLNDLRDQSLYQEVGRLTRSLHESIRNFQIDTNNSEQHEALSKMSDASDRLKYVVDMTSKAANRTMDLVEEAMPRASILKSQAGELYVEWQKLRRRELSADQFRALYSRLDTFLLHMVDESDFLYVNLSEILLAQDFQDLTGQTIQKVTTLVKEVEENLLSLVVMAGHVDQLTGTVHELGDESTSMAKGEGPQMNAEEREDVVSGQDDVDDLLSSLGF